MMAGLGPGEVDEGVSCLSEMEEVLNQIPSHGFSTPADTVSGSGVPVSDPDLLEELSGCMENPHDIQQLAAGLMEMENELACLMDDTSFLQFPTILQEVFPLDCESSPRSGGDMAAIAPSISHEYLCPQEQVNSTPGSIDVLSDNQLISNHPLLPLVKRILQRKRDDSTDDTNPLGVLKSCSDIDAFMAYTVSVATQLSKDSSVGHMSQILENEGCFFTSEMSMFCQNLLKPDPVPSSDSVGLNNPPKQVSGVKSKKRTMKENKIVAKPKTKSGEGSKQRVRISQRSTNILREWLLEHADNPFPTDSEKDMLCLRTGLTLPKLNVWFVNSRRRILAPLGLRNYHKEIAQFNKKLKKAE